MSAHAMMLPAPAPALSPNEAEAALEAALLAGAEGGNARSRGVELFLAMSAGLILERMQMAGLAMVRAEDRQGALSL